MPKFKFLFVLDLVLLIIILGCTPSKQSLTTIENTEYSVLVNEWVNDYSDDLCEELGDLASFGVPGVGEIIGQLIKDNIVGDLDYNIIKIDVNEDTSETFITVEISRAVNINADLHVTTISKTYAVKAKYILNIKNNEVKDFDIDLESFSIN